MSAERGVTIAFQTPQHRPLGSDAAARRRVLQRGEQFADARVVLAAFNGESALAGARDKMIDRQQLGDAVGKAEPAQSGGGQDDGIVLADVQLVEARVQVAAEHLDA